MSAAPLELAAGQKVYVGGKFFSIKPKALGELIRAQGASTVRSNGDGDVVVLGGRFTAGDVYAVKPDARVLFEHELADALGTDAHRPDERVADWVSRFSEMLRTLIRHPKVRVALVDLAKPATDKHLAAAEKKLGGPLPPMLAGLYATYGSWTVLWQYEDSPLKEATENLQMTIARLKSDWCVGQRYDGSLRILPLPKASGAKWRDALWGGANDALEARLHEYAEKLGHQELRLWLFDYFSEYSMANLLIEPEQATVLYGTAHGADLAGSRPSTIAAYLDAVVASYLSVEGRREMFHLDLNGDPTQRFKGPHVEVDLDSGSHARG